MWPRAASMLSVRRAAYATSALGTLVFLLWLLPRVLNPTPPTPDEKRRDDDWVDTSPYWLDRQACRWLSLCGVHHLRWDAPALPDTNGTDGDGDGRNHDHLRRLELRDTASGSTASDRWLSYESRGDEAWEVAPDRPSSSSSSSSSSAAGAADVPDYVLAYAPLVHLFSGENFWPSFIGEHLSHMVPYTNGTPVRGGPAPLTLDNLAELNHHPKVVYLTSEVDVETRPEWLHSHDGIPVAFNESSSGGSGGSSGGSGGSGGNRKNKHSGHEFADDTTWYDVDRDHPLRRISDPRKLAAAAAAAAAGTASRSQGPEDVRARQLRRQARSSRRGRAGAGEDHQVVLVPAAAADEDAAGTGGGSSAVYGYKPDASGYSKAPAILVLVDKGSGILDAFWFFFYSYNLGQTVLRVRYGNHVGDWEHCMIRFENGVPRALFLSEHAGGQAYAWSALEKFQPPRDPAAPADAPPPPERPVIYSAVGSHAMYALPGTHPYVLPFQMLRDETDKGPLWDPAKNNLAYFYDYVHDGDVGVGDDDDDGGVDGPVEVADADADADAIAAYPGGVDGFDAALSAAAIWDPTVPTNLTSLTPAAKNPDAPTSWFHFLGPWGDELYELGDRRQWRLFGQYHYIDGPQGPKFKNLGRQKVCQTAHCRILYSLDAGKKSSWYS